MLAVFACNAHVALADVWLSLAKLSVVVTTDLVVVSPSKILLKAFGSFASLACIPGVGEMEHYYSCKLLRERPAM